MAKVSATVSVGTLPVFNHEHQEWQLYKERLEQWFLANEIGVDVDKAGCKRRAILLSNCSESSYKLIRDLASPRQVGTLSYDEVVALLDGHFKLKKCTFAERYKFHSATQHVGEGLPEWAARVRGLAIHCGFVSSNLDEQLRDRFVLGMASGPERDKLFTKAMSELTLSKALEIAEGVRSARMGAQETTRQSDASTLLQVMKLDTATQHGAARGSSAQRRRQGAATSTACAERTQDGNGSSGCTACGYAGHQASTCRFVRYKCKKCGVQGHLKRMCKQTVKKQNYVECCEDADDDGGVWSLRNLSISVPRAVLSGEGQSAILRCSYDLEDAALYSIRWYKAETEFYRYVPREMPPTMVFPLPGASVDLTQSDHQQVRIVNLNRRLSGDYQCEVSADAPLFHTDIRSAPLTVVDPPFRAPHMSITGGNYVRGDVLRANCSIDESYPAANITWLLNDHKIAETVSWRQSDLDFKERGAFSRLEISILEAEHYKMGLTYTSASLSKAYQDNYYGFEKQPEKEDKEVLRYTLIPPPTGQFTLSCMATIYDIYVRKGVTVIIKEDAPHPASVTGEDSSGTPVSYNVALTSLCASAVLLHTL